MSSQSRQLPAELGFARSDVKRMNPSLAPSCPACGAANQRVKRITNANSSDKPRPLSFLVMCISCNNKPRTSNLEKLLPANQRAAERQERLMDVGPLVVPHVQAAETLTDRKHRVV